MGAAFSTQTRSMTTTLITAAPRPGARPAGGPQTVTEGTDAAVELATRGGFAPTGTFVDRSGVAPF
jgi:hypothetical protein